MVYGRYNYSIHGVYKATNQTGGHQGTILWESRGTYMAKIHIPKRVN